MLYESETIESVFVAVRAAVAVSARRGAGDGAAACRRRWRGAIGAAAVCMSNRRRAAPHRPVNSVSPAPELRVTAVGAAKGCLTTFLSVLLCYGITAKVELLCAVSLVSVRRTLDQV